MPVLLSEMKAYLGTTSLPDATIQDALDAESAAQARILRSAYLGEPDVEQALKRRVVRNLELRGKPFAIVGGDIDGVATRIPGRDPEIRRLEAPYMRWVVA